MRSALLGVLAVLLAPGAGSGAPAGEPVPEGAVVSVSTDKTEYLLGERVVLRYRLTNTGALPFRIVPMTWQRFAARDEFVEVSMVDQDGRAAWDPFPERKAGGGPAPDGVTLARDEFWEENVDLWRHRIPDRAGTFRIRISRAFWDETPERPNPSAEVVLRFREPTVEEAGKVLEGLEAAGARARFHSAAYPVYVPLLEKRAAAGRAAAAQGLLLNRSPEATRALLRLFASGNREVADAAGRGLVDRIRVPTRDGDGEGRRYRRLPHGFLHAEEDMVPAWRPEFHADARAAARAFLGGEGLPVAGAAADVLCLLGTPEDGPALVAALDHLAAIFDHRGSPESEAAQYLVKDGDREEETLSATCWRLFRRGLRIGEEPLDAGEALLWLEHMAWQEEVDRPASRWETLHRLAGHPRALVRRNVARAARSRESRAVEAGRAVLARLAEDPDDRVRRAARGE